MRNVHLLLPILFIVCACSEGDGGKKNTDKPGEPGQGGNGYQCEENILTDDIYKPTSYDCTQTSTASLRGTWMVTSEYQLTSSATAKSKKLRFTMTITDTDSNHLNAFVCNPDASKRNIRFDPSASSLSFFDYSARAQVELNINNNRVMSGRHLPGGDTAVIIQESKITAIKILDTAHNVGQLALNYSYGDNVVNRGNLEVHCFLQDNGTSDNPGLESKLRGEHFNFMASENNESADDLIMSSVFIPTDESQSYQVGLFFDSSKEKIQGRWDARAAYEDNTPLSITLNAEVTDDYSLTNQAEMTLQINL